MQATFGQTRQDMAALRAGLTQKAWVEKQFAQPVKSHRAYFRQQANPPIEDASSKRFSLRTPWRLAHDGQGIESFRIIQRRIAILKNDLCPCPFTRIHEESPTVPQTEPHPSGSRTIMNAEVCRVETQRIRAKPLVG